MNTELRLVHNISSSNKHGKSANDYRFTDLVKNWTWQKTASGSNDKSPLLNIANQGMEVLY